MKDRKRRGSRRKAVRWMSAVCAAAVLVTSLLCYGVTVDALVPSNPDSTTQTGYTDLISYQEAKWAEISKAVFGDTLDAANKVPSQSDVENNKKASVQKGNQYFNWAELDDSITPWNGKESQVTTYEKTITYEADSVEGGNNGNPINAGEVSVTYTVYDVYNADQLFYAFNQARENHNFQFYANVMINILNDIDLNGSEQIWEGPKFGLSNLANEWLYIEGNGHTIYNMKSYNNTQVGGTIGNGGFLGYVQIDLRGSRLVYKNLNFSNCMTLSADNPGTAIAVGAISCPAYLENINVYDSFVFSNSNQTGALIGRTQGSTGNIFIRNCSSQNCYVYGANHTGGLTGCQHNTGSYNVKYSAPFPESPEAWLDMSNSKSVYPEVVENCYSVDCTVYSVGVMGDSGGLFSCGGKMIVRNCFTNNIVYGRTKTGAFIGRIVTAVSKQNGIYDDEHKQNVEVYFENCFASGSIEGTDKIGGFVGFEVGAATEQDNYGIAVYKNCYTTAMVGMDYAGGQLGGFIGHENTKSTNVAVIKDNTGKQLNLGQKGETQPGSVYINCYAAGEVGNILTDTKTAQEGQNYMMLGGFLGVTGYVDQDGGCSITKRETSEQVNANYWDTVGESKTYEATKTNGTYINCYYDMQTTAMRERACGRADQFTSITDADGNQIGASRIPGVTGVYTQHSEAKGIEGLADTVDMGDDTAWADTPDDQYPMLKAFYDDADKNFATAYLSEPGEGASENEKEAYQAANERITSQLSKKAELVKKYSRASVSTVLLDHWDSVMNIDTGSLADENDWVPGVAENALTYVEDSEKTKWDDPDLCEGYWEKTYTNLAAGSYEFKIQEGTSWAYNYGSDKFNGENMTLQVEDDCDVTIRFKYDREASTRGDDSDFEVWADFKNSDGEVTKSEKLGWNTFAKERQGWYLTGSFEGVDWALEDSQELRLDSDGLYSVSLDVKASDTPYEFKIVCDPDDDGVYDWAVNYGVDGVDDGDNMSFIAAQDCTVTFQFDDMTHITTITSSPADALSEVTTRTRTVDVEGYSVIGDKEITGFDWFESEEAVKAGLMTPSDEDPSALTSKPFTITADECGRTYAYKIIEDGVNAGQKRFVTIGEMPEGYDSVEIYFTYDPGTGKSEVHVKGYETDNDFEDFIGRATVSFYSVLGTKGLTGLEFDWDGDADEGTSERERQAAEAAEAGTMTASSGGTVWSKTYSDVPAGTHAFKVVANGLFSSNIDYGSNDGSGNYRFTTNAAADITITFDDEDKLVSVEAKTEDGTDALVKERYVVSGNTALTGENWATSSEENEMEYNERTGAYTKTYTNLSAQDDDGDPINYSFKIVEYGRNNSGEDITFRLANETGEEVFVTDFSGYKLEITYWPQTQTTTYHLYDTDGNRADQYLTDPAIDHYSVIGDEGLTGYNWMGPDDAQQAEADAAGRMSAESEGIYTVTFSNVAVGSTPVSLGFKVVANGTWESGISYGKPSGDNYTVTLASAEYSRCSVTITFNEETKEISVTTTPDCTVQIDEDSFQWYICGVYNLVSDDAYNAPVTVYDTVRDITHAFGFTSGSAITWENDKSQESANRNYDNAFYERIGQLNGSTDKGGFDLTYEVDGKTVTGNYDPEVIELTETSVTENGSTYMKYSCTGFVPGKRWLTVKVDEESGTSDADVITTSSVETGDVTTEDTSVPDDDITADAGLPDDGTTADTGVPDDGITADTGIPDESIPQDGSIPDDSGQDIQETDTAADIADGGDDTGTGETDDLTVQDDTDLPDETDGQDDVTVQTETDEQDDVTVQTETDGQEDTTEQTQMDGQRDGSEETAEETDNQSPVAAMRARTMQVQNTITTDSAPLYGVRNIRLIPTVYLEAGADAEVDVLQSGSDLQKEDISNVVTYESDGSEDITYTGLKETVFGYYNFAMTAAYAITDLNGIGYYGSYSRQNIQKYDKTQIRSNVLDTEYADSYFAMTSVFNESGSYSDANNRKFTDPDGTDESTNLKVDTLVSQSLIGSSYSDPDAEDGSSAKTIVKIYKVTATDTGTSRAKVFMDSTGSNASYYANYLKWTGQQAFDANDAGTYEVDYFWTLSDGRYLTDTKTVTINSRYSDIEKAADPGYVEMNAQLSGSEQQDREITYTLEYTNRVEGDFTICDILPFNGDARYDETTDSFVSSTLGEKYSYTLRDIQVTVVKNDGSQTVTTEAYYTSDTTIRGKLSEGNDNYSDIAEDIVSSGNKWISWDGNSGGVSNPAAIAVKGSQAGEGTSNITVTFKISVSGLGKTNILRNNSFFSATDSASDRTINGYSEPVSTAVVGRALSGYVWIDLNLNGKYEDGEPVVEDVKVSLYKDTGDGAEETEVSTTSSDEEGFYSFEDLFEEDGTYEGYEIRFAAPEDDEQVTIHNGNDTETESFSDLVLTRTLGKRLITDLVGSRNIAYAKETEDGSGNTSVDYYYINEDSLPDAATIAARNWQSFDYGKVENYYYTRGYQNLGLAYEDYKTKTGSVTVLKVDADNDKPLKGAQFMLEYSEDGGDTYNTVWVVPCKGENGTEYKYASPGTDRVEEATAIVTDKKGQISFTGLPVAHYRLTEVGTAEGYNLLGSSIEFDLPYKIDENDSNSPVKGSGDENDGKNGIYYNITYTVKNSRLPHLPSTGSIDRAALIIVIAFGLAAIGFALNLVYKDKNKH